MPRITINVSQSDLDACKCAAAAERMSLSTWICRRMLGLSAQAPQISVSRTTPIVAPKQQSASVDVTEKQQNATKPPVIDAARQEELKSLFGTIGDAKNYGLTASQAEINSRIFPNRK